MQITITAISRKERTSKKGRPFTSLGLKCEEYGERWLSGFGNARNKDWKKGDKIEVEVENTGQYLNFTMPEEEKGTDSGPAANNAATAELKNILMLRVIPQLEQINKDLLAIDERISVLAQRANLAGDDDFPTPDFDQKE